MASGFSFKVRGANGSLSYRDSGGFRTAAVRMKTLSYNYGVASEESHAREERAFYPHRRVQGQFRIVVDCIGYREFKQLMSWLQIYASGLLAGAEGDSSNVSLMDVALPARNFHKIGILTTGIDDHTQVGAMVFDPELVFVALSDPQDPAISLLKTSQVSQFRSPQIDANLSTAFYPVTVANYKDSLLYDDLSAVNKDAAVTAAINPVNPVDAQFFANQKDSAFVQPNLNPVVAAAQAQAKQN
jgi:hypothetical protein